MREQEIAIQNREKKEKEMRLKAQALKADQPEEEEDVLSKMKKNFDSAKKMLKGEKIPTI